LFFRDKGNYFAGIEFVYRTIITYIL